MIETKVPMDVRKYKAKLIGPFTSRQLICLTICIAVDLFFYLLLAGPAHIPIKVTVFILVMIDCPILAFTLEPLGMPMEKYLKNVLLRMFLAPIKRRAKSPVPVPEKKEYSSKETKASKKKMKKLKKSNPEYRAYK